MRVKGFVIAVAMTVFGIAGTTEQALCAAQVAKEFDVVIRYTAEMKGNRAVVRGALKNVRFARMEEIELKVTALDVGGKTLGEQRELLIPVSLPLDQEAQFAVEIPLKQEGKPTSLRFLYRYRPNEGEREQTLEMRSITAPFGAPPAPSVPR